jgi:hypothetical protein
MIGCSLIGLAFFADLVLASRNGFGWRQALAMGCGAVVVLLSLRASHHRIALFYLALFSALTTFVAVEVAIRLAVSLPRKGYGVWAGFPGSELILVSAPDKFEALHRYNNLGFRGPDVSLRGDTELRIICIGDSFTEGIGVEEGGTWPAVLQEKLSRGRCEVVNLGAGGLQAARYLDVLANVGIPLRPSHVIICVNLTDMIGGPDVPPNLTPRRDFPDPLRERKSWLASAIATSFSGWTYLYDRMRGRWISRRGLYWERWGHDRDAQVVDELVRRERISRMRARRLAAQRMARISRSCMQAAREGTFNPWMVVGEAVRPYYFYRCRVNDMEIEPDDLNDSTTAWVKWYAECCKSYGIIPILLFFPESGLVNDDPCGPVENEQLADRPTVSKDDSIRMMLSDICKIHNIKYIDPMPVLREHAGERLFLRYDGHPTENAHRLVGRVVAESLSQDGLAVADGPRDSLDSAALRTGSAVVP